ncbi:MAG: biotin/lipoyl-binding protein, partial [Limnobacter sp.]|nr:biotin/lipoyl-binding protein [Limnobacter sp.]
MKKFLSALAYAWKNRETLGDSNYEREIAQFLPAALSVQHAPPHPLARWLTWALIALFSLAVLWACIGQIDIVASAEGKIIPSSRVKVIQPLEKSVVRRILVSEGQLVEQGQALVELDNTLTQATESQLQAELGALATNLAQTRLLFDLTALPVSQQAMFNAETMKQMLEQMANDLTPTEIQNASEMAWQQWQDYWSQYQALQNSLKKTQAEQMATQAQITKLEHTLPLVADRLQKVEQLYSRQYVAQAEYFELKQRHIEHIHNLQSEQQRLLQLQAQEAEIQESLRSLAAKAQAQRLANI